jgi:hypothetical protein
VGERASCCAMQTRWHAMVSFGVGCNMSIYAHTQHPRTCRLVGRG